MSSQSKGSSIGTDSTDGRCGEPVENGGSPRRRPAPETCREAALAGPAHDVRKSKQQRRSSIQQLPVRCQSAARAVREGGVHLNSISGGWYALPRSRESIKKKERLGLHGRCGSVNRNYKAERVWLSVTGVPSYDQAGHGDREFAMLLHGVSDGAETPQLNSSKPARASRRNVTPCLRGTYRQRQSCSCRRNTGIRQRRLPTNPTGR